MTQYVLNIRPGSDAEQDAQALRRRGVAAMAAPVMNIAHTDVDMPDASQFTGLLFTSRHAIDAFCAALDSSGPESSGPERAVTGWFALPVFVVGHATAAKARLAGFNKIITGAGGGAGLVPHIRQHHQDHPGPLLWPAAADKSFDLVAALQPHGIAVVTRTVYQAVRQDQLPDAICDIIAAGQVAAVISMSARTSRVFVELLQSHNLWHHRGTITLIAGSDGIATAAGDGWREIYVARAPKRTRLLAIAVVLYRAVTGDNEIFADDHVADDHA